MKKPLSALMLPLLLGLAACNNTTSTVLPSDNRDTSPVNNTNTNSYSGVAIDGYLRNAFVWLDLNDNKRYDTCTTDFADKLRSNACEPEPYAISGTGGKYVFDLTAMQASRTGLNQPLLDPEKYPTALLAIPGVTIDEGLIADGNTTVATLQSGYYLLSPPGQQVISPLTTMVKHELDYGLSALTGNLSDVAHQAFRKRVGRGDNFFKNYAIDSDERLHAYARALAAVIQSHTPESYQAVLNSATFEELAAGGKNPYLGDATLLIGRAILSVASQLLTDIDTAVGSAPTASDYARLDVVNGLTLPKVNISLENKMVLVAEHTKKNSSFTETSGLSQLNTFTTKDIDTSVTYEWATNGELSKMSIDGYMQMNFFDDGKQPIRLFYDGNPLQSPLGHFYIDALRSWGSDGKADIETSFTHDAAGQIVKQDIRYLDNSTDQPTVTASKSIAYTFTDGKLTGVSSDEGKTVAFSYDGLGRLSKTLLQAGGQDLRRAEVAYAGVNNVLEATVTVADFTSGGWVESVPEKQVAKMSGSAYSDPLASIAISEKFGNTNKNYIWVYEYYGSDDGNLAGLLKTRTLLLASSSGVAEPSSQIFAKTTYEYKALADVIFK
ncbi:MAG: hypothetical protein H6999_04585 [Hahellaceae bacterium]|nr:hypothetical protein [Hahellaceae bacterium]MCP5169014.1 hypothetical protein [Hahellaceae bacterium]